MSVDLLRELPSVNDIMDTNEANRLAEALPRWAVRDAAREIIGQLRAEILSGSASAAPAHSREEMVAAVLTGLDAAARRRSAPGPRAVINATGIVLHTNLGRAPLPAFAAQAVADVAMSYSDLEFNLETGERGSRQDHAARAVASLLGAEAAYIVNNNAAAVLLCLDTLVRGKQAIVSRGELVEIGGSFRVPDIMERSGATLVEVGTTNRTRISDYERAITDDTGMLLKVHTSNFKVVGFTEEASLDSLAELGRQRGIPVMHDIGSGLMCDLSAYGMGDEPTVADSLAHGVDLVTFSGDKLFGGPQAGIIVGRADMIKRIMRNPLARALRIDKLTLTALACVVAAWADPSSMRDARSLPVPAMLTEGTAELRVRAERLLELIAARAPKHVKAVIEDDPSEAGGGSMPALSIPGVSVILSSSEVPASDIQLRLRHGNPPVVARVAGGSVRLHMRTVFDRDLDTIAGAVVNAAASGGRKHTCEVTP